MSTAGLLFFLFAVVYVSTAQEEQESCVGENIAYERGETFISIKSDGRMYECICRGIKCHRLVCSMTTPPTPTASLSKATRDEDADGFTPNEKNPNSINADSICMDRTTGAVIQRGVSFLRFDKDRMTSRACTCPAIGPATITCSEAVCSLPDPPKRLNFTRNFEEGCFDSFNNQEYASGASYTRTRYMDSVETIPGLYQCICSRGLMSCTALEIPCCDSETGFFVPKPERFVTVNAGIKVECTCDGGRAQFSQCTPINPEDSIDIAETPPLANTAGFLRTRDRLFGCKDSRWTGQYYAVDAKFTQDRGRLGIWQCSCNRYSGTNCRISCRKGA